MNNKKKKKRCSREQSFDPNVMDKNFTYDDVGAAFFERPPWMRKQIKRIRDIVEKTSKKDGGLSPREKIQYAIGGKR